MILSGVDIWIHMSISTVNDRLLIEIFYLPFVVWMIWRLNVMSEWRLIWWVMLKWLRANIGYILRLIWMMLNLDVTIYRIMKMVSIWFLIGNFMRNMWVWIGPNVGRIWFDWSWYSPFRISRTYLHFEFMTSQYLYKFNSLMGIKLKIKFILQWDCFIYHQHPL